MTNDHWPFAIHWLLTMDYWRKITRCNTNSAYPCLPPQPSTSVSSACPRAEERHASYGLLTSSIIYHLSSIIYHLTSNIYHLSYIIYHPSSIIYHLQHGIAAVAKNAKLPAATRTVRTLVYPHSHPPVFQVRVRGQKRNTQAPVFLFDFDVYLTQRWYRQKTFKMTHCLFGTYYALIVVPTVILTGVSYTYLKRGVIYIFMTFMTHIK
jgi:hypothetical protein